MLRLAFDGFVGFSTAPLRFALALGLFMAAASVLYGIVAIAMKLAGLALVPGYASLLVTITFLSGVQLIVIGMVGQYVARIYDETRARPLYLVRDAGASILPPGAVRSCGLRPPARSRSHTGSACRRHDRDQSPR